MLTDEQIDMLLLEQAVEVFGKRYEVAKCGRFLWSRRDFNRTIFVDSGLISLRDIDGTGANDTLTRFYETVGVSCGGGSFPQVKDLDELKRLLKALMAYHRLLHMELKRGCKYFFEGRVLNVSGGLLHLNVHHEDNWSTFAPFVENKELWARRWIPEFRREQQFPCPSTMEALTEMWNDLRQRAGYKVFSLGQPVRSQGTMTGPHPTVTAPVSNRRAILIDLPQIR